MNCINCAVKQKERLMVTWLSSADSMPVMMTVTIACCEMSWQNIIQMMNPAFPQAKTYSRLAE